jgi:nicotinamidase/pyrazinamidase
MKALIVVDFQNDFCDGGSLEVKGALSLIPKINNLISSKAFEVLIFTKCWHPSDHVSFAVNNEGRSLFESFTSEQTGQCLTMWPAHCVQNTAGAEFPEGLLVPASAVIVNKGTNSLYDSYSGFGYKDVEPPVLLETLQKHGVKYCAVVGLAYDYCVVETAKDAVRLGFQTAILEDLTLGISPQRVEEVKKEFAELGGEIKNSPAII